MDLPTERPPAAPVVAAARRVVFGFGLRELGVGLVALSVLAASGLWYQRHARQNSAELDAVRTELAIRADAADVYRERFAALTAEAEQIRRWADAQPDESLRTWARERARRFDALVAAVDQQPGAAAFEHTAHAVRDLVARGELAKARALLAETTAPVFPALSEFTRLRDRTYVAPLTEFSRQNPAFYRAFRQAEPDAAKADETALRAEITAAGAENVTPQLILKVDLLAAVAASDDPVVAEWSALTSAMDYFDSPDGATLARWRRAQHALRVQDWPTAAAEMQAIAVSKVRTRQPFRAALGRALIKSQPDQPTQAYPYLVEAASAGDKQARMWVAQEDFRAGRYAQAQRWAEMAAADGDRDSVPLLVNLYRNHAGAIAADPARQIGVLERVTNGADPSADAYLLLGQLYEQRDPPGSTSSKAVACYVKAAAKGSGAASLEVARCALGGIGTPVDLDQARDSACEAYTRGQHEPAARLLQELLRRAPERVAGAVERLFARESVAGGGGYMQSKVVDGPGVTQLKAQLARYLDQAGQFGQAARFYAASGDPLAVRRHAELTTVHPCETCGGRGKIQESTPCPTCGGKGKQICGYCGGSGYIYVPGSPPCATCGGSGTIIQDRKVVACSACGGTGKGKGSVIKQDCTHCEHGYIRCPECINGMVVIWKECPDCHGKGSWRWVDKNAE